jgi:hypothetical protein
MHFCPKWPGEGQIISGMRNSCKVMIEADLLRSLKAGIKWYVSKNQVVLTAGVNGVLPTVRSCSVYLTALEILQEGRHSGESGHDRWQADQQLWKPSPEALVRVRRTLRGELPGLHSGPRFRGSVRQGR